MAGRNNKERNEVVETPVEEIKDEIVKEDVVKEDKKAPKKKRTFVSTDGILCRSVTPGALYVDGPKSGMTYTFSNYGDETEIEYRDLKALVMTQSKRMFTPNFIVEDADFVEEVPQLAKFYEKQFTVKDLRNILSLPVNEMVEAIKNLPAGAAENMRSIAATAVDNGALDSIKKIKALDEIWGTQFSIFSSEE